MEGLIEELEQVRRGCHSKVKDSKLVTCASELVRVEITKTKQKSLVAIFKFPEDYPCHETLIELRSKTFNDKFLEGITKMCEQEARKYLGEPQILLILKLITKFIDENPLCCCSSEISVIKRTFLSKKDVIKLKQKTSSIVINICEGLYFLNCRIQVPHNYPETAVIIEVDDSSFPEYFCRVFMGHAKEIVRRCVEPPINKKQKTASFQPQPSLTPVVKFLTHHVHQYPTEKCPICGERNFSENPADLIQDVNNDKHVERILCGHLYHLKCLSDYMKTPPFTGGKKCLVCRKPVSYDKYKLTPELAEARWAHHQARLRELEEVVEFLA